MSPVHPCRRGVWLLAAWALLLGSAGAGAGIGIGVGAGGGAGPRSGTGAAAGAGAGSLAATEAPLADAGLDQTVNRNATVYLDATGSYDPDGEIDEYDWTIESPTGVEFAPVCGRCGRTRFMVTTTGVYEATVTVTDDDGATRSDTLFVTVETIEPPSVQLSGPGELLVGTAGQFDARATAGDRPLTSLTWLANGTRVGSEELNESSDNATLSRGFDQPGEKTLRVRVVDRMGRVGTDSVRVAVVPRVTARRSSGSSGGSGGGNNGGCRVTDGPLPDPCEDEIQYDTSDGTAVLDDGNNDGVYTAGGVTVKEIDVTGRMTDTIRVDQSVVDKAIRKKHQSKDPEEDVL